MFKTSDDTITSLYSWRIRDQLDITSYVLFHFFYAQHVSDINTSIIRSLRLFYCITTLVVCSCFDACWRFGVAGLRWYPCSRLMPATRIPHMWPSCILISVSKSSLGLQNVLTVWFMVFFLSSTKLTSEFEPAADTMHSVLIFPVYVYAVTS